MRDDAILEAMIRAGTGPTAAPKAVTELTHRLWNILCARAYRALGDRDDSTDVALAVFERLPELLRTFDQREPVMPTFLAWLGQVVDRQVSHFLRDRRAQKRDVRRTVRLSEAFDEFTESDELHPDEAASVSEEVEAALARLTVEQREVVAATLLGESTPQIAKALGTTTARAKRIADTAKLVMRDIERLPAVAEGMRRCSACEEVKPLSEFSPKGDGLIESRCRPCNKERAAQKRERDPEAGRKAAREYQQRKRAAQRLSKAATSLADQLAASE